MVRQFTAKASAKDLCGYLSLPRSVYYYVPLNGRRGARPSTHTFKKDGTTVSNEVVMADIRTCLSREFCCYGYHMITDDLRDLSYIINDKKVYRLMDENNLLLGKVIRSRGKREFAKHRRIDATYPMEFICMDIKYIWVDGERRNYFLLTILDVFTRKALEQIIQASIRHIDVIDLLRKINHRYGIKGVTVRNDNGSQFIAGAVKQFLRSAEARQEFTHIATPEENAYIEAFHSIVQREVVDRFEFASFYEARQTLQAHLTWYNYERKHGELGRITPQQKWDQYEKKNTTGKIIFALSGKAEAGNAGEQPARNNLNNGDCQEGMNLIIPSFQKPSLLPMPLKTQRAKEQTDLNSFEKSV